MSVPEGVRAKLDRAEEHLATFNDERRIWLASHAPRIKRRWANEYTEAFAAHDIQQPPVRLSVLIGDFAHNVRSALDHLIFALWTTNSGPPIGDDARKAQFPLELSNDRFKQRRRSALDGLSEASVGAVEQLQPYNRPRGSLPPRRGEAWEPRSHPLWLLKQLSNIDKHRVPPLTVVSPVGHTFDPVVAPGLGRVTSASTGPVTEGRDILHFAYRTQPSAELVNPTLYFGIGFGDDPGVGLDSPSPYAAEVHLSDIMRFVTHDALPILSPYLGEI